MPTNREGSLERAREALLAILPDALAMHVYGSFASGEEWPQSDLDLAVLLPPEREIPDFLETTSKLSKAVGRTVDIVDLRRAGDTLRREVLEEGRTIFVSDADLLLDWEASAISRCARHREEISEILDEFRSTGIGYSQ